MDIEIVIEIVVDWWLVLVIAALVGSVR